MPNESTATGVFVHPQGICESAAIGERTRVWAFAHVLPGARIGRDCNICEHVFVENDVIIGDRVTVKSGVQLWDGLRIADDVFIGPNATFANDKFPRSRNVARQLLPTHVEHGASIGGGACILAGVRIGADAMVGAGAFVTHDVPPRAVVFGNPARIVGYVDGQSPQAAGGTRLTAGGPGTMLQTAVPGVTVHHLQRAVDLRGRLVAAQAPDHVPFVPRRAFLVYDVPGRDVRGEHAHRQCHQFLIAARGSLDVIVDSGREREEILLDRPELGLYLPPMVWAVQHHFSQDAVLLVLASDPYDADDYIRSYDEFLDAVAG
jgi:UDP-2-acetamido-3-amino-2,3-dideoxy-glucuronate N-acetyltransferase